MPRGRDECWDEVHRNLAEDSSKRHPRVTCKHCETVWTSNEKARVIEHLGRCLNLPERLWRTYQPARLDPSLPPAQQLVQQQQQQQQQRARTRVAPPPGGGGAVAPPIAAQVAPVVSNTNIAMAAVEQDLATAACAHWIAATGLNLTVVDHPAFKSFMRALRPNFKPPTRHSLKHALFDAPLMFIAYLADPQQERQQRRAQVMFLESNEETLSRSLQTFLLKYCDNNPQKTATLLGGLSLLKIRQGPFSNGLPWMHHNQHMPAMSWWQGWHETQPDLAELCLIALAICPASDVIERDWSVQHLVTNLKQHNVAQNIIDKILPIFWSLRIKHGWIDDGPQATDTTDQDAEFTPDIEGFVTMQG